jgi:hypothetical protein
MQTSAHVPAGVRQAPSSQLSYAGMCARKLQMLLNRSMAQHCTGQRSKGSTGGGCLPL